MFPFTTEKKTEETEKSGIWASQFSEAAADARSRGVGRKKSAQSNRKESEGEETRGRVSEADAEKIRMMFSPESWRAIVRAPFALGKAVTGRECWELEQKQEDTLATSTAGTAEYFLQTDPKWVMLTLFCFNWTVVLTEKFAKNAVERAKEEAEKPPSAAPMAVVK